MGPVSWCFAALRRGAGGSSPDRFRRYCEAERRVSRRVAERRGVLQRAADAPSWQRSPSSGPVIERILNYAAGYVPSWRSHGLPGR
jgi:hypothetical protein